ncbi:FAD-dependent oxidoreductase [Euzebya sp.]|uniref:FAD-dependent oxidoreductase n=1 Tax=Euzebya sp. TaxID=1971409 RepID=UPI0035142E7C
MTSAPGTRPPRVVCIGGGYCALFLVKALRRAIRRREVELVVVSRTNFHAFHGFVGEMLSGRIQPQAILSPARRVFAPAVFMNAEVTDIDLDGRAVTLSRLLDGREQVLDYDHLVVSVGVTDDLDGYPGLDEHALLLRDYRDAWHTRNHLIQMMEMAAIESDPEERRRLLTFVVAGGGFGGVEVATELDEWASRLCDDEFADVDRDEVSVVLVHSGQRILPELQGRHDGLIDTAEAFIARRTRLDVRTGVRVASATATDVRLSDGTAIPTRTVISSTGTASSPLLDQLPVERDDRGRVVTDETVAVPGVSGLWAGGDCAAVPHPHGGTCPQLALFAMVQGWRIGRNILRLKAGKAPKRFGFTELGDACALGRYSAVAHLRGVPVTGFAGWLLWKGFLLAFVPAWDRRLRLLLDWTLTPLTGREITQLPLDDAVGLDRERFEAGQEVFRQGEMGRKLYVIWSGEVEVVKDGEVVATLGPGQHFGETAVFEELRRTATVRATVPTEVIAMGRSHARTLSETLLPFGDAVRARPTTTRPAAPAALEETSP